MYTFFQVNVVRKFFTGFRSFFLRKFHVTFSSTSGKVTTTGAAESKSSSFDYSFDFTFSSFLNAGGFFSDVPTMQIYCR